MPRAFCGPQRCSSPHSRLEHRVLGALLRLPAADHHCTRASLRGHPDAACDVGITSRAEDLFGDDAVDTIWTEPILDDSKGTALPPGKLFFVQ